MNRKMLSLLLAPAMCFALLTACSSGTGSTQPSDSGTTQPSDSGTSEPGEVYTLTVTSHDSATSMCQLYIETLFGQIEEESNGQLKFNYFPGGSMFGASESIDAVKDGAADICWANAAAYGGVFPITEFLGLCGNGINSARMATDVYNAMIQEIPECAAEYDGWKVLVNHACSYAPISTVGIKIETPDDFKGLQIRAAGAIPTLYINALGATAISMPTSDTYEALSKNVIQGMANDWHNIDCFKLYEPIDYCMDVPVSPTACFLLMNQAKYDSLPEDLQALFEKYCTSGYAADMAGYWWDSCNFWVADKMIENGVEVYEPSQEVYDFMNSEEVLGGVHQSYIEYLNDADLDGQAIYDQCMAIVERIAPDYTDPFATEFHYTDWDLTCVEDYVS